MNKVLVVVDMQNDFITGSLGTEEAQSIVKNVKRLINQARKNDDFVVATKDTHFMKSYFATQEGENLPVIHCIKHTEGWEICDSIKDLIYDDEIFEKTSFGSIKAMKYVASLAEEYDLDVLFCGLCTDICVISNVVLLKAIAPEVRISVKENACAGVSPEKHDATIEVMRSLQVNIV